MKLTYKKVIFFSFAFIAITLLSCKEDPATPAETKLDGKGTATSISMINDIVDNPVQGISMIVRDESGNRYKAEMLKASSKANGTVHFKNSNLVSNNTTNKSDVPGGIVVNNLNTPNTLQIDFYEGKEQMGLSRITAGITANTEFAVAIPDDQKRERLKNNINSDFKSMINETIQNTWAQDINYAEEGDQHQRVAVTLKLLPE